MPDDAAVQSSRPTIVVDGRQSAALTGGQLRARGCEKTCTACMTASWRSAIGVPTAAPSRRSCTSTASCSTSESRCALTVADQPIFSGRITGIEARFPEGGAPSLTVLAEDRFQDLRMTRRTRTFTDVSDADVATQIAGDYGLTPRSASPARPTRCSPSSTRAISRSCASARERSTRSCGSTRLDAQRAAADASGPRPR